MKSVTEGSAQYSKHAKRIVIDGLLYMRAWYALGINRWCNIELHVIYRGDGGGRGLHCHPSPFVAITLWGRGHEMIRKRTGKRAAVVRKRRMGRIRFYRPQHAHRVVSIEKTMVTLTFQGPRIRIWGYHKFMDGRWQWRPYLPVIGSTKLTKGHTMWRNGSLADLYRLGDGRALTVLDKQMGAEGRNRRWLDKPAGTYVWEEAA